MQTQLFGRVAGTVDLPLALCQNRLDGGVYPMLEPAVCVAGRAPGARRGPDVVDDAKSLAGIKAGDKVQITYLVAATTFATVTTTVNALTVTTDLTGSVCVAR